MGESKFHGEWKKALVMSSFGYHLHRWTGLAMGTPSTTSLREIHSSVYQLEPIYILDCRVITYTNPSVEFGELCFANISRSHSAFPGEKSFNYRSKIFSH